MQALAVGVSTDPRCCRPEQVLDWLREFVTAAWPRTFDASLVERFDGASDAHGTASASSGPGLSPSTGTGASPLADAMCVVSRDAAGVLHGLGDFRGLLTACSDALQRNTSVETVAARARAWVDADPAFGAARAHRDDRHIALCVPSPFMPLGGPEPFAHAHACFVFTARRDRARPCFTAHEKTVLETACQLVSRVLTRPVGADGATDHEHWQRLLAEATDGVVEASAALDALQVRPGPAWKHPRPHTPPHIQAHRAASTPCRCAPTCPDVCRRMPFVSPYPPPHTHTQTHTYTPIYAHIHTYIHLYTHIHTHIYTYTLTYTHIHSHTRH